MKRFLCGLILLVVALGLAPIALPQAPDKAPDRPKAKHGRGHKLPAKDVSAARHRVSNARYGHFLRSLPKATAAAYDEAQNPAGSRLPPIGDQGQCGDCYMWSGFKVCSAAQMTAGAVKPGSGFMLSVQWGLDYHPELGLCDGGDEYQVAQVIVSSGSPSLAQYPGSGQGQGQKQPTTGMTIYSVASLVYVDPAQTNQGVASIQSIKNGILANGYVSVAGAASSWDNVGPNTTITGSDNQIDHAIGLTGWDDNHDNGNGTKGAWIVDNQWGTSWGNNGRAWIAYGADSIGTEAFIAVVNAPPPPPAPPTPIPPAPPVPPTPVPPVPPTPVAVTTITTSADLPAGQYQVVPSGSVVIYPGMTLRDFLDAQEKCRLVPTLPASPMSARGGDGARLDVLERGVEALLISNEQMRRDFAELRRLVGLVK